MLWLKLYLYWYVRMCKMCITNMHQSMVSIMFDLNSANKCLNINKPLTLSYWMQCWHTHCSCGCGGLQNSPKLKLNFFESDSNLKFLLCFKLNAHTWSRAPFFLLLTSYVFVDAAAGAVVLLSLLCSPNLFTSNALARICCIRSSFEHSNRSNNSNEKLYYKLSAHTHIPFAVWCGCASEFCKTECVT